jgi:hypothetical protein
MGTLLDSPKPLTPAEARAEYDYRFLERIGMMSDEIPPSPSAEQIEYAQAETMKEVRLVKAHACNPARISR